MSPDDCLILVERLTEQQVQLAAQLLEVTGRLTLLDRLAAQQLGLNAQLIEMAARLNQEHARYGDQLTLYVEHLARVDAVLAAIMAMLDRPNGH